jgi:hypothetical protein
MAQLWLIFYHGTPLSGVNWLSAGRNLGHVKLLLALDSVAMWESSSYLCSVYYNIPKAL